MTKMLSGLSQFLSLNKRQDGGVVQSNQRKNKKGSVLGERFKSSVLAVQSCQLNMGRVFGARGQHFSLNKEKKCRECKISELSALK